MVRLGRRIVLRIEPDLKDPTYFAFRLLASALGVEGEAVLLPFGRLERGQEAVGQLRHGTLDAAPMRTRETGTP